MATSSNNPWADQSSSYDHTSTDSTGSNGPQISTQNPWQLTDQEHRTSQNPTTFTPQQDPWADAQHAEGFRAPQGPPPGQQPSSAPRLPDETARFVPESERSEQREALEQFEITHGTQQSTDERNLERLTQEFPKIDSALVAAIYSDSKDVGTSRELLTELSNDMR